MCYAIVCGFVTGDALVSYWPIFYFLQLALDKRRSERLPTVHCDCVSDKMAEFSIARFPSLCPMLVITHFRKYHIWNEKKR